MSRVQLIEYDFHPELQVERSLSLSSFAPHNVQDSTGFLLTAISRSPSVQIVNCWKSRQPESIQNRAGAR